MTAVAWPQLNKHGWTSDFSEMCVCVCVVCVSDFDVIAAATRVKHEPIWFTHKCVLSAHCVGV